MPAYSFMKQFIPDIESGIKTHTLRNKRKAPTLPGQLLSLYYAMRTKHCQLLLKAPCTYRYDVEITYMALTLGNRKVKNLNSFAISDGFPDWPAMVKFWRSTHELPWSGELISWGKKDPIEIFCK